MKTPSLTACVLDHVKYEDQQVCENLYDIALLMRKSEQWTSIPVQNGLNGRVYNKDAWRDCNKAHGEVGI